MSQQLETIALYQNKVFFPKMRMIKTQKANGQWSFNFETYVRFEQNGKQYLKWCFFNAISDSESSEAFNLRSFVEHCYLHKMLTEVDEQKLDTWVYLDPDQRTEKEKFKEEVKLPQF